MRELKDGELYIIQKDDLVSVGLYSKKTDGFITFGRFLPFERTFFDKVGDKLELPKTL